MLSTIFAKGKLISNWFDGKSRLIALIMIQICGYSGYAGNGMILRSYVNNTGDLSIQEIKAGVQGFLDLMIKMTGASALLVLFAIRSEPRTAKKKQRKFSIKSEKTRPLNDSTATLNLRTTEVDLPHLIEKPAKLTFCRKFAFMCSDAVFPLALIGSNLGTCMISTQNIAMPVILKSFGFSESQTLSLSVPGTAGAISGMLLYTIFLSGKKNILIKLQIITALFAVAHYCFWSSFLLDFVYVVASKFMYSVFNGPQEPLILELVIQYCNGIGRKELILLATSASGMIFQVANAVGVTFVGRMMSVKTRERGWEVEFFIFGCIVISFFSDFIIDMIVYRRDVELGEEPEEKKEG